MGDTHGSLTRREILKRGAIVGGGVLWVTPVVQTIGMGTASAQAVSGPDPCSMTPVLKIPGSTTDCVPHPNSGLAAEGWFFATFFVHIPPECICRSSDASPTIYIARNGTTVVNAHDVGVSAVDWYSARIPFKAGDVITFRCSTTPYGVPVAEGDPVVFTGCS